MKYASSIVHERKPGSYRGGLSISYGAHVEMTDEEGEFQDLIQRVRDGSDEAAEELVEKYGPHIRAVVSKMLDPSMRQMFDSMDFVQETWASLVRIQSRLEQINNPRDFMAYIAQVARHKVVDEIRRRRNTAKYDISRNVSLQNAPHFENDASMDRGPTPSELFIANEWWENLLAEHSPKVRKVLKLRRKGATFREIAEELEMHETTVRKIVKRLVKEHEAISYRADQR